MKLLYSLILSILLLSIVSAQITINPSTIDFDYFPGDSIIKNITINTDGNYTVYLNYLITKNSSFANISVSYSSPIIVEKSMIVPVEFNFSSGMDVQNITIQLTASTESYVDTPQVIVNEVHGGGGMAYVLPNGSITYKKPIKNDSLDTNPLLSSQHNQTNRIPNLQQEVTSPETKGMSKPSKIVIFSLFGIAFIFLVIFLYLILERRNGEEKSS